MAAAAGAFNTGTFLLRKSVLIFGSGGTLGSAVARAFAAAHWRVIGCSTGWSGSTLQRTPNWTSPAAGSAACASLRAATAEALRGRTAGKKQNIPAPVKTGAGAAATGGEAGAVEGETAAEENQAAAVWPGSAKWQRGARGLRLAATPPHAVVDVVTQSFERAFSLQKQGEDLLEQLQVNVCVVVDNLAAQLNGKAGRLSKLVTYCVLCPQPLLVAGPPLHAAICCSGAFDMSPPNSPFFLDEAQRLIKANCWPALLCAHIAAVLQQNQDVPLLLVLTGAAAVAQTNSTPSMVAYGCAKSYVHHLVRSLAAASVAAAPALAHETKFTSETAQPYSQFESSHSSPRLYSSHDKDTSNKGQKALHKQKQTRKKIAFSRSLRVIGLLPTILHTPANVAGMKDVSEKVRTNTWTEVKDVAQQLLDWAEKPEKVENGRFYVVNTRSKKTEFSLL